MMQIFVKKPEGNNTTLNVESNETILTVKRKLREKEGIRRDLYLGLIYNATLLEDWHTVAYYNISKQCTLRLFLSQDSLVQTYIINFKTWSHEQRFTLNVTREDTLDNVKAKIQKSEGIPQHKQLLFHFGDKLLEDGSRTLADYHICDYDYLNLAIQLEQGAQSAAASHPIVTSRVAPQQIKRARPATPNKATSIFDTGDGEATAALNKEKNEEIARNKEKELEATISRLKAENKKTEEVLTFARNKEKELEATVSRLKAENKKNEEELMINARNKEKGLQAAISELKAGNKKTEEELTIARNKEKELEATVFGLKTGYKKTEEELTIARNKEKELEATISGLKTGNKKTEEELTIARNKEKELEASISRQKAENKKIEEIARNKEKELHTTIFRLKAENKKNEEELTIARNKEKELGASISNKKDEEELTIARNKEKELEATISGLRHKNKVFSDQCASYESQVDDLEVENKKTREELMNAEKKYYAGARAAGYAEGLKEGKAKRFKSVKFLHHLTDASMRYFNHGFDSCQKQAEEQGFCGQLNKDSALKDAPDLKGWESSHQPH